MDQFSTGDKMGTFDRRGPYQARARVGKHGNRSITKSGSEEAVAHSFQHGAAIDIVKPMEIDPLAALNGLINFRFAVSLLPACSFR